MARVACLLIVFVSAQARAWMRSTAEDAELVARSEVIAIAHLEPGSVQFVDLSSAKPGVASSIWEHHATLVITATIKGHVAAHELPIVIHYGLKPSTSATAGIEIVDTADAFGTVVDDATADHIWCLRKRSGDYGREPGHGNFGIVDPEDVQPMARKDYLALYLAPHPEAAIKAYVAHHAEPSAERYLEHLEIQRILKLEDPAKRIAELLPHFNRARWGLTNEVFDGLVAAGDRSGPALLSMFGSADRSTREDIITIWGRTRFRGAVPTLVALLQTSDQFWAKQALGRDWWSADPESLLTIDRHNRYSEVYGAVYALGQIGDRRAKAAIELTLQRWQQIAFENPQIVDECRATLAKLAK